MLLLEHIEYLYLEYLGFNDQYPGVVKDFRTEGGLCGAMWTNGENIGPCLCSSGFSSWLSLTLLVTAIAASWSVVIEMQVVNAFLYLRYKVFQKFKAENTI